MLLFPLKGFRLRSISFLYCRPNAYTIYCRPILEYTSMIWYPFSKVSKFRGLIDHIEIVQISFNRRLIIICVVYTNLLNTIKL